MALLDSLILTEQAIFAAHIKYTSNIKEINRLKVKEWKNLYHVNTNQEKTGKAKLKSDKIDFRAQKIK